MSELSESKLAALEAARNARRTAQPRTAPEGYRGVPHFLADVREVVNSRARGISELAAFLQVGGRSVRRWIDGDKLPMQRTIAAMAIWVASVKRRDAELARSQEQARKARALKF